MYFPYQKAIDLFRLYVLYQYTNYAARYVTKRADAILCSVASRRVSRRVASPRLALMRALFRIVSRTVQTSTSLAR